MSLMTRPRKAPVPDLMPVRGYVVLIVPENSKPRHLTCSDLLTQKEAADEVNAWRGHARERGNRLVVCSVVEDWGLRVLEAMEDDDDD